MSQPVTAHKSKLCLCHQLRNDASLLWSVWRGSDLGRPARTGPVVRFRARLCARIIIETSRSANWSAVVRSGPRGTGPSLFGGACGPPRSAVSSTWSATHERGLRRTMSCQRWLILPASMSDA